MRFGSIDPTLHGAIDNFGLIVSSRSETSKKWDGAAEPIPPGNDIQASFILRTGFPRMACLEPISVSSVAANCSRFFANCP